MLPQVAYFLIGNVCLIGHIVETDVKPRDIHYYTTANGKQPVRKWLESVKDSMTQAILYKRIRKAGMGNFVHTRSVGGGVSEFKIDFGLHKDKLIVLLVGGTKRTQQADIEMAKDYWNHWKKENDI